MFCSYSLVTTEMLYCKIRIILNFLEYPQAQNLLDHLGFVPFAIIFNYFALLRASHSNKTL